ncbi:MAG TPA: hypothetical protein VEJ39_08335, partial [Candidatus Acidoferrales bacterium]|nr:hypothetical protein [Candidatus Acidoferrales bacterium]
WLRTSDGLLGTPSEIIGTLASTGICVNTMLHPTQPARLAVAAKGFRFSIADFGIAKQGIKIAVRTRQISGA